MRTFCLVVADAARARVYSIAPPDDDDPRRGIAFTERADLINSERRRPLGDALSDKPGMSYSPTGRGFGLDDHRRQRTREVDRRFAVDIATAARTAIHATAAGRVVVIASSRMLGLLRQSLQLGRDVVVEDHALDLTRLSTPQLHAQLAELGVVPAPVRAVG